MHTLKQTIHGLGSQRSGQGEGLVNPPLPIGPRDRNVFDARDQQRLRVMLLNLDETVAWKLLFECRSHQVKLRFNRHELHRRKFLKRDWNEDRNVRDAFGIRVAGSLC
jgi:hypothetical protein